MATIQNIPKLRFPGFDGEWELKKLGEIITNKSGKFNPVKEKYFTKCIELEHLATGKGQLLGFIDGRSSGSIKNKFNEGDVLFGKLRPYLKKYLLAPFDGVCSSEIWVLKGIKISNFFLYQIVQTNKFIDLANQSSGSKMPRADWNVVENGIFSSPTLPEQQKIASFLSAVDEKIQQLSRKKELVEQYKKGVMQQLFSGKLRFKPDQSEAEGDENGKDYPDWEKGSFSKFIKLYRGSSPRPIIKYVTTAEDGVNWIKIGDTKQCKNYRISSVSEKITKKGSLKSRFVEKGEIILANSMSFGKSYLLELEGCIYDGWFVLREYEKSYIQEFLLQVLNSEFLQRQYFRLSTGGVVQNISSEIVYSTLLFRPVLEEQQKIANFLSGIDDKIENTKQEINQMQSFKKGLLQQLFV